MKLKADEIYQEYEKGKEYLQRFNYYGSTEECWRFFQGDQWNGLKIPDGADKPPVLNIIEAIVKYKIGIVNSSGYAIDYTPMGYDDEYIRNQKICGILNAFAQKEWERLKFDSKIWKHTKRAAVSGDSYAYFFYNEKTKQIEDEFINNVSVMFADEQEVDIQKQKYILIIQRKLVAEVQEMAKHNGVKDNSLHLISSDSNTEIEIGAKAKEELNKDSDEGKVTLITKMYKDKKGIVHIIKCTKNLIVMKDTEITGMDVYPIAHLIWSEEEGSCRGMGSVYHYIPNQVAINKANLRYSMILQQFSFPHTVYNSDALTDEEVKKLSKVGANIGVKDRTMSNIGGLITYLPPPQIPADSFSYANTLMNTTRELAGASDATTGQVDPTKASGAAIQAVQDAAALPLNDQQANLKQFIEDIARIWIKLWSLYFDNVTIGVEEDGIDIETSQTVKTMKAESVSSSNIQDLNYVIKVDISPANPYSKFSQEQTLLNFLSAGLISFPDYVNALPSDAAAPKSKLEEIIVKQQKEAQQQQAAQELTMQNDNTIQALLAENAQLKEAIQQLGGTNGNQQL